jgi:hypothetical protein
MSVTVHADSIITAINDVTELKVKNTQHGSGGIGLFGEGGTVAQFNDVRVRKYADVEPVVSLGSENQIVRLASLKVFLEGPYAAGEMTTALNAQGLLPLTQPYDAAPWNYACPQNVIEIPGPDVTDWILVELRDAPDAASATSSTTIARQAAFLMKDGSVVGMDGSSPLFFQTSIINQLFLVIMHRNHLGIMSANGMNPDPGGEISYDFTTAGSQAYNGGQINMGNDVYGMISGDADGNGTIELPDKIQQWTDQSGNTGYLNSDVNLDGQVNNNDKNDWWLKNLYLQTEIPD